MNNELCIRCYKKKEVLKSIYMALLIYISLEHITDAGCSHRNFTRPPQTRPNAVGERFLAASASPFAWG